MITGEEAPVSDTSVEVFAVKLKNFIKVTNWNKCSVLLKPASIETQSLKILKRNEISIRE